MSGKYSIKLFREGGEGAGIERVLVRRDDLTTAPALYRTADFTYPERLIMLCDKARVLARSDRPDTMPPIRRQADRGEDCWTARAMAEDPKLG